MQRRHYLGILALLTLAAGITTRGALAADTAVDPPPGEVARILEAPQQKSDLVPAALLTRIEAQGRSIDRTSTHLLYSSADGREAIWLALGAEPEAGAPVCVLSLVNGSQPTFDVESANWAASTACTKVDYFAKQGILSRVVAVDGASMVLAVLPDDLAAAAKEDIQSSMVEVSGNLVRVIDSSRAATDEGRLSFTTINGDVTLDFAKLMSPVPSVG